MVGIRNWGCNLDRLGGATALQSPGGREEGTWYHMLTFIIIPTVYEMNDERGNTDDGPVVPDLLQPREYPSN